MPTPQTYDWWYDDARQVGLDFEDEHEVATYDARQGGSAERDRALLTQLGLQPHMAMADIGCGTGILAREAAGMCRSVTAIDVSAAMLAAAQARAGGLANLSFQRAGFLSFEAKAQSLDLITAKNALHHLPDFWKAMALARIFAALKPGGRLYLRDVMFAVPPGELAEAAEGWIVWLSENTGYSRAEGACHVREEYSTFAWAIERMLTDTGYRIVEHVQDGVYGTFVAERPAS
ncbi:MAG: SAM-dependent methyltransferase [Phenylobacterium sp.]|uniref:class I SAM-dependent methyltransferase n=1 Tax=Phenylobacterium sp. TaxID=1871053 RepID=UPI0025FF1268|nr:class I SAM-dependent methyltransferase [Phenylobacterium sp.]MBA4014242.1 SAM-dependent methyltransferase [Phenylobacterium sp.]